MKKYSKEEKKEIRETRKANFKRFKRNLRLAKRRVHFRVWKRNFLSSLKSDAKNITRLCFLRFKGFSRKYNVFKKSVKKISEGTKNSFIVIKKPFFSRVGYIYVKFHHVAPESVKILAGKKEKTVRCDYLHQLFDVREFSANGKIKIEFGERTAINMFYVFSDGETLPSWVQKWCQTCDKADMLAMSTHSDDEQLFFAGILPLYRLRNKVVQVSYFAPPGATHRFNELLDGLWQIGIRNYPIFAPFKEGWSTTVEEAKEFLISNGTTTEDIKKFIVSTIRKLRPKVVIGQDLVNGEYGHGQHAYFAKTLKEAVPLTADANFDKESADRYGVYTLPKLYLHLYPENQILIDVDIPFAEAGGLTPFNLSQEGFSCHRTQYVSFFPRFLYGTVRHPTKEAKQIKNYSPCKWGLAYTTVGDDKKKDDMFENID